MKITKNLLIFGNFQNKIFDLGRVNIKISLYSGLALVVFLITILSFSSYNVLSKQIKVGEMMAIIGVASSLLSSITNLALVSIPIQEAKVAFDRIFEYASIPKEKLDGVEIQDIEKVEIKELDFRFKGRSKLLENITLTLEKGKITCLLGESGSGKTTFTEILQKNYKQESGSIIINNHFSLKEISTESWRNHISIVPQNIQLFNASFLENIILDNNLDEKKMNDVISLGFKPFINILPQGLMTIVGEEGINLSGGQKQLLGWMRALYHNSKFLILDEPTSSLDKENRDVIYQLITKIKNDKIIFVISHNLEHLEEISDEILYLREKRISRIK